MINIYDTIDTMINLESQCETAYNKYKNTFYTVGQLVGNGDTLETYFDLNTYGMLREYMPQFEIILDTLYTSLTNALQVCEIWENNTSANKTEEASNAVRTFEALNKEFMAAVVSFNALANTINDHTVAAYKNLSDKGLLLEF